MSIHSSATTSEANGNNETLKVLFYSSPDAMGIIDLEGTIIDANKDITIQKKSEAAYRNIAAQLYFTLEKCHIGAWSMDLSSNNIDGTLEHSRLF